MGKYIIPWLKDYNTSESPRRYYNKEISKKVGLSPVSIGRFLSSREQILIDYRWLIYKDGVTPCHIRAIKEGNINGKNKPVIIFDRLTSEYIGFTSHIEASKVISITPPMITLIKKGRYSSLYAVYGIDYELPEHLIELLLNDIFINKPKWRKDEISGSNRG